MNTATKMKTFVILEKYVGYADITIEAETEQEAIDLYNEGSYNDVYIEAKSKDEAIALYNRGHYKYSDVNQDDMFYNYQFDSISEVEDLD